MRPLSLSLLAAVVSVSLLSSETLRAQAPTPPQKTPFETLTQGMRRIDGMWTLYQKDQTLLAELSPAQLSQNYMVLVSIAKGISSGRVIGGMTWQTGDDDVVWTFNKVGEKLHVVQRNFRFRANPGTPEATAVSQAYSDSILYALPILTTSPTGGLLVDVTRLFMSDDWGIGRAIGPGFFFAPDRSTWAKVKGFDRNVELQVAAVYQGSAPIRTVADSRGVQVNVHYSISLLGNSSYRPRIADDRVGYFLTVLKDFSDKNDPDHFVRYINRWDLQKKDPAARISPPVKPIVFHIERTLPVALRPIVWSGIEEWNKAFEKLGFSNAVQLRQQEDGDTWDPEDVNYNTFRWITADAGFAMGPSRVHPGTGQILDADIIFDAGFLQSWKTSYETYDQAMVAELMGGAPTAADTTLGKLMMHGHSHQHNATPCQYCKGKTHQMAFATAVWLARNDDFAARKPIPEELLQQGLKEVVMHEVGHTLGLRHNFKASAWKTLSEIDDPLQSAAETTIASVMDYAPVNVAAKGARQSLYYPTTLGPYDYWAIEYGYKPIVGDEAAELKKIASRSGEPGLDYATDEDTRGLIDSDPHVNRFDLGRDPVDYAKRQIGTVNELLPKVVDRAVAPGEGYQRARQMFGMLFGEYWRTLSFVARVPGGIHVNRNHKGDAANRPPYQPVDARKQREAMDVLNEYAFNVQPLPAELLNYLASSRWSHWGAQNVARLDYPIHDQVAMMQARILGTLFSPVLLDRLYDGELKQPESADVYTLAEHLRRLSDGIFSEWKATARPGEYTVRKPYIVSFRRNLQRMALQEMVVIASTNVSSVPEDARNLARMHLGELRDNALTILSAGDVKLDDYTRAHLLDAVERIRKALDVQFVVNPTGG
jgi:hypothetical protein